MREKWQEFQTILEEMATIKKREYFLTLAVCVLSGLVIGMLVSPRKKVMIGSNNGNNSGNSNTSNRPEGCECDDCCDCEADVEE